MKQYRVVDSLGVDEEQGVDIEGYRGTWSAFEKVEIDGITYYIYEHDRYGDMTNYLVVGFDGDFPLAVYETYDGLLQCLLDEEVISDYDD